MPADMKYKAFISYRVHIAAPIRRQACPKTTLDALARKAHVHSGRTSEGFVFPVMFGAATRPLALSFRDHGLTTPP